MGEIPWNLAWQARQQQQQQQRKRSCTIRRPQTHTHRQIDRRRCKAKNLTLIRSICPSTFQCFSNASSYFPPSSVPWFLRLINQRLNPVSYSYYYYLLHPREMPEPPQNPPQHGLLSIQSILSPIPSQPNPAPSPTQSPNHHHFPSFQPLSLIFAYIPTPFEQSNQHQESYTPSIESDQPTPPFLPDGR
jgi:hypothetical protein